MKFTITFQLPNNTAIAEIKSVERGGLTSADIAKRFIDAVAEPSFTNIEIRCGEGTAELQAAYDAYEAERDTP